MEGEDRIRLLDRPEDGDYCISVSTTPREIAKGRCQIPMLEVSYSES